MSIRVIDIETTGQNPNEDAIVEIASVDVIREGYERPMSALVNPGRSIPAAASAVHHLIDADVREASSLEQVIQQFVGADAYVAHNCAFERGFLGKYLGDAAWICTYKCALRIWPDFVSHSNQALRYQLGLISPFGLARDALDPHRAGSDAIVTAAIFLELTKHASWSQMVDWSKEPALIRAFRFGKHKGQKLVDVPSDYLSWIVDKSDLDEDVKFSARRALVQRQETHA